MHSNKLRVLIFILLGISATASAQSFLGVADAGTLPTKAALLNPSNIVYAQKPFGIDILGLQAGLDQSYGAIKKGGIRQLLKEDDISLAALDRMLEKNSGDEFDVHSMLDAPLLSAHMLYKEQHHLAFQYRLRTMVSITDYNAKVLRFLLSSPGQRSDVDVSDMRFVGNAWKELAFTYARTVYTSDKARLNIGFSPKYVAGMGFMGANISQLNATIEPPLSAQEKGEMQLHHFSMNAASSARFDGLFNNLSAHIANPFKGAAGWGLDMGISYEQESEAEGRAGTWRLGLALRDIGRIYYRKTTNLSAQGHEASINLDSVTVGYEDVEQLRNFLSEAGLQTSYTNGSGKQAFRLPASLSFNATYYLHQHFSLQGHYFYGFVPSGSSFGNTAWHQAAVVLAYERPNVYVGLPLVYNFGTQNFKPGLGLNIYGVYLGVDNVANLLGLKQVRSTAFYVGWQLPITWSFEGER